jgi:hypothetical protein
MVGALVRQFKPTSSGRRELRRSAAAWVARYRAFNLRMMLDLPHHHKTPNIVALDEQALDEALVRHYCSGASKKASKMKIVVDDLSGPQIASFLEEHIEEMRSITPPESKHALDLDALRKPEVTFWSSSTATLSWAAVRSRRSMRATPR